MSLAYKVLPKKSADLVSMSRAEAESDLIFCGFLISECPLKADTKRVIKEFK